MKKLKIREIFYSIQGEGGRSGGASVFIRLAYCNLNCWYCDTDWSSGVENTLESILENVLAVLPKELRTMIGTWIVWTGGEPTIQLTDEIVAKVKEYGFKQAIETNGTNPVPNGIDYISCSPKEPYVTSSLLHKNFPLGVDEFRYPLGKLNKDIPNIEDLPKSEHYFVSPIFMGKPKERFTYVPDNVVYCLDFVKRNPQWKLSLQLQKIINIK